MAAREAVPGYKTTEFAVAMAIILCATLLMALSSITEPLWGELTKFVGGAYIVSRGLSKI